MKIFPALVFVAALAITTVKPWCAEKPRPLQEATYIIHAPQLAKGEVIIGFEVDIKNGATTAISGLPIGWSTNIVNEPQWGFDPDHKTKIEAGMTMGTLSVADLRKIRLRLVKGAIEGKPFDLSGTLSIDMAPDFQRQRSVDLKTENFEVIK